jgi:hypothetical protein
MSANCTSSNTDRVNSGTVIAMKVLVTVKIYNFATNGVPRCTGCSNWQWESKYRVAVS